MLTDQGMHKVGFQLLESFFLLRDITLDNAGPTKFPYSTSQFPPDASYCAHRSTGAMSLEPSKAQADSV